MLSSDCIVPSSLDSLQVSCVACSSGALASICFSHAWRLARTLRHLRKQYVASQLQYDYHIKHIHHVHGVVYTLLQTVIYCEVSHAGVCSYSCPIRNVG